MGKPITQSLFLELAYTENSMYTLKEHDYMYKGKLYPSLKRLFLETEDPTEYQFATKYLLGWRHWIRICENKQLKPHVAEWRDELEVKLRSQGVVLAIQNAKKGGYQASKWLADRGWDTKGAGRPSKADIDKEKKIQAAIDNEYGADVFRLFKDGK